MLGLVVFAREIVPLTVAYTEPDGRTAVATFDRRGTTHWWRGPYRVLEDGRHFGPHTVMTDATRARGGGRYTVWRGSVWLTASDHSNPATNGKRYEIERPFDVPLSALAVLLLVGCAGLVMAAPGRSVKDRLVTVTGVDRESAVAVAAVGAVLFWQPWSALMSLGGSGVASLTVLLATGLWIRRDLVSPSALTMLYPVIATFAVMLILRTPDPTVAQDYALYDRALRVIGVCAAVAAYWRPVLGLVTTTAYVWTDLLLSEAYAGLPVDAAGIWIPLSDGSTFLVAMLCTAATARRALGHEPLPRPLVDALVVLSLAPHFGNYAHSAFAKITLDGGPLSWLVGNQTQWLLINAQELGVLPFGAWSGAVPWVNDWFTPLVLPMNVLTLATQLAASVAVAFPAFAAALAFVFDVWHLGIAVTTGIFFWKWMLLNAALIAALRQVRTNVPVPVRVAAVCLTLLSPSFFYVVALGWYDTPAVNVIRIRAVTDDGRKVDVPSDWFRQQSFVVVSQYAWKPELAAALLPTDTWGTTKEQRTVDKVLSCDLPLSSAPRANLLHEGLARLIMDLHRQSVLDERDGRRRNYALYPHHIWSTPFAFGEFYRLSFQRVQAYEVRVVARCRNQAFRARTLADVDAGTILVSPSLAGGR
jgi:hypothetical protein